MFLCLNSWNQLIGLFNVKTHHRIHAAFVFHAVHMLSESLFIKMFLQWIIYSTPLPHGSFCEKKDFIGSNFSIQTFRSIHMQKNLSEWLHVIKYMSYQQLTMQWLFTIYSMISACIQKCFSRLKSSFAFKSKITINFFYKIN